MARKRRPLRYRRLPAGRDLPRLARGGARPWAGGRLVRLDRSSSRSRPSVRWPSCSMIPWELQAANPVVDLRMLATRQFGSCFLVMLATGAILIATTQFIPQLVQQDFGYTATWAGLVLSPGGVVTMLMMFVMGRLSTDVQPKYLIVAGAIIIALAMYDLTRHVRRSRLLVLRLVAHVSRRRSAADLHPDHWRRPTTAFRRSRPTRPRR